MDVTTRYVRQMPEMPQDVYRVFAVTLQWICQLLLLNAPFVSGVNAL